MHTQYVLGQSLCGIYKQTRYRPSPIFKRNPVYHCHILPADRPHPSKRLLAQTPLRCPPVMLATTLSAQQQPTERPYQLQLHNNTSASSYLAPHFHHQRHSGTSTYNTSAPHHLAASLTCTPDLLLPRTVFAGPGTPPTPQSTARQRSGVPSDIP